MSIVAHGTEPKVPPLTSPFHAISFYQNETYLHERFLRLSQRYNLIPKSLLIIPHNTDEDEEAQDASEDPKINLSRRSSTSTVQEIAESDNETIHEAEPTNEKQSQDSDSIDVEE